MPPLQGSDSEAEGGAPKALSVDKEKIEQQIADRDYDMALHFSSRSVMTLDPNSKAKSFVVSSHKEGSLDILVSFHSNRALCYSVEVKKDSDKSQKLKSTFGEMEAHQQGVRGIAISANDNLFATNSFDSVKLWSVDLFMYANKNKFSVQCRQSVDVTNVLSMSILPGNKFIVLGTKEGELMLYDLN